MTLNPSYIGHVIKETVDNLVVFEEQNERFDIPFSGIKTTVRNLNVNDIIKVRHIPTNIDQNVSSKVSQSLV